MTDDLYYRKMESTSTTDLVDMIRERDGRIAKLEKENAELKETNESLLESCAGTTMMYEDLCKAKEIIKNLMVFAEIDSREYEKEYKEAEQFLKEVKE
jgi:hypothetical protein